MRIPSSLRSKIQLGRENRAWVSVARAGPGTSATDSRVPPPLAPAMRPFVPHAGAGRRGLMFRRTPFGPTPASRPRGPACERVGRARLRRFDQRAEGITLTTHEATQEPAPGSTRRSDARVDDAPASTDLPDSLGLKVAGWVLHAYTAVGMVFGFLIVVAAFQGDVEQALWLGLIALDHRRHRRDGRPPAAGERDDPVVRRCPARRHRRLPHLRLRADGAALDRRLAARRLARKAVCGAAAARVVLPVLPDRRQDGRPLLPRLPELLERRCVLRLRARPRPDRDSGDPGVCTVLVFVPIRYVYPSRTKSPARRQHRADRRLAGDATRCCCCRSPDPQPIVVALSLAYLAYYTGLSIYLSWVLPRLPAKRLSKDAIAAELDD